MVSIALVCLLVVLAAVEIRQYNKYTQQISAQEQAGAKAGSAL